MTEFRLYEISEGNSSTVSGPEFIHCIELTCPTKTNDATEALTQVSQSTAHVDDDDIFGPFPPDGGVVFDDPRADEIVQKVGEANDLVNLLRRQPFGRGGRNDAKGRGNCM